ncbi:hypothetical protein D3C80_1097550 [compost metagenome]
MQQIARHGLDIGDVRFHESITEPRHAQYAHAGAHTGFKGAGVQHFAGVDFTGDANQRGDGQHKDHDGFVTRQNRVLNQSDGVTDRGGIEHHRNDTDQEQQHGAFRMRFQLKHLAAAQSHFAFRQTFLIDRIVFQLSAEEITHHGSQHDGNQRDRNTDRQQRQVAHAQGFKNSGEEDDGR